MSFLVKECDIKTLSRQLTEILWNFTNISTDSVETTQSLFIGKKKIFTGADVAGICRRAKNICIREAVMNYNYNNNDSTSSCSRDEEVQLQHHHKYCINFRHFELAIHELYTLQPSSK